MSYKAADKLKKHFEVEFLKSLTYEEINNIINKSNIKNHELIECLGGLLNDFQSHIGEHDCEPSQAGYILKAEELLLK